MKVQLIKTKNEFRELKKDWNNLLQNSSSDSVFLTWEMLYYWWESFSDKYGLHTLLAQDKEGELVGVAPLYIKKEKRGFSNFKVLRIISDQHYSSRELDFICKKEDERECFNAFWEYLLHNNKDWDLLYLFGILPSTFNYQFWQDLYDKKKILYGEIRGKYSLVDLSSWDSYLNSLKPRMRTKVRAVLKKYEVLKAQGKIEFLVSNNHDELPKQIDSFIKLHQERWHQENKQGMFDVPGYETYFREVLPKLLSQGWLMFTHLKHKNNYIAHQLCLDYNGVVHLINEGFDIKVKDFNPGNMLRAQTFQYLNKQEIKTYDFLNNISQHKLNWGAKVYFQYNLEISYKNFNNRIYFLRNRTIRAAKKAIKSVKTKR